MKTLKADELKKTIADKSQIPVINVLDRGDFNDRHIPGSINVPLSEGDFVQNVQQKLGDKTKPVILYCASSECDASEKAAKKLEAAGFTDVRDFESGIQGWEDAGYKFEGKKTTAAR